MKNIVLRTYGKMWKFERKIYAIDDVKLPIPINPDEGVYFLIGLLITIILLKVLPFLSAIPFFIKYLAIPYGLMKFLTKKKFDGKLPHKFLLGYLDYIGQPKQLARFQPAKKYKKACFAAVIYRRTEIVNLTDMITRKKGGRKNVSVSR